MSATDSAAEVAEDYQHALDDLNMNSRIEIGNLTSVAKDSLQHAHAIAEVLQNHIKKVGRPCSLPTYPRLPLLGRAADARRSREDLRLGEQSIC